MGVETGFSITVKLFALLTPSAILSAYITYTRGEERSEKRLVALKTGLAIFLLGSAILFFAPAIFAIFDFTLDAFRIGVGILLFLSAVELMKDDGVTPPMRKSRATSVVPLAIPLGMGPSTIGTIVVMATQAPDERPLYALCLFLASAAVTLLLIAADHVQRLIGKTGIIVMAKLTALLLAAIAAQVIFTGIKAFLQHMQ